MVAGVHKVKQYHFIKDFGGLDSAVIAAMNDHAARYRPSGLCVSGVCVCVGVYLLNECGCVSFAVSILCASASVFMRVSKVLYRERHHTSLSRRTHWYTQSLFDS